MRSFAAGIEPGCPQGGGAQLPRGAEATLGATASPLAASAATAANRRKPVRRPKKAPGSLQVENSRNRSLNRSADSGPPGENAPPFTKLRTATSIIRSVNG